MFLGQCLTLAFNESVELFLEIGHGLTLLFAEAAGLLAKIPGFCLGIGGQDMREARRANHRT